MARAPSRAPERCKGRVLCTLKLQWYTGAGQSFGTANLDYRNFYELNLMSRDPELSVRLQAQFIADLE
jgi:hypothetical protein